MVINAQYEEEIRGEREDNRGRIVLFALFLVLGLAIIIVFFVGLGFVFPIPHQKEDHVEWYPMCNSDTVRDYPISFIPYCMIYGSFPGIMLCTFLILVYHSAR